MNPTDAMATAEVNEEEFFFGPPAPGEPINPAIHDLSHLDLETRRKMLIEILKEGLRQARNGECRSFDFDEIIAELDAES